MNDAANSSEILNRLADIPIRVFVGQGRAKRVAVPAPNRLVEGVGDGVSIKNAKDRS